MERGHHGNAVAREQVPPPNGSAVIMDIVKRRYAWDAERELASPARARSCNRCFVWVHLDFWSF
jgi:hypothetical protein